MGAKKGHVKFGGRKKGSKNKLTNSFKQLVQDTFQALEADSQYGGMVEWAKANRTEFYKIASKLIPQDMSVKAEVTQVAIEKTIISKPKV